MKPGEQDLETLEKPGEQSHLITEEITNETGEQIINQYRLTIKENPGENPEPIKEKSVTTEALEKLLLLATFAAAAVIGVLMIIGLLTSESLFHKLIGVLALIVAANLLKEFLEDQLWD